MSYGLASRVAAIEKKLGIEVQENPWGMFWDDDDDGPEVGCLTGEGNECSGGSCWDHFIPFTTEEMARFRSLSVPFKYEE